MKDGTIVRTADTDVETPESLITAMLGRTLDATFPPRPVVSSDAKTVLEIEGLTRTGAVEDISLELKAGEILGVAGLIGSGRSELVRCVFGADRPERGTIRIDGVKKEIPSPRAAIRHGIALLPESRKTEGLLMSRSIGENMTLAHLPETASLGFVRRRAERTSVRSMMAALDVRAPSEATQVSHLSGGNQQKVLFGKWLFRMPRVLLADEPTRGVDVGAKRAIYELIVSLAEQGLAVLLISSELEEVLGLAHRVVVMRGGRIVGRFDGPVIEEEDVMRAAFGDVGT
jgi:ABC-type sugar transport system ATPase subunit